MSVTVSFRPIMLPRNMRRQEARRGRREDFPGSHRGFAKRISGGEGSGGEFPSPSLIGHTRVAMYGRVSTSEQDVDVQLRELREYAARRGWSLHGEYADEGVSGTTPPALPSAA